RKSNPHNFQSYILKTVSFHNKILKGVTKDGSFYSILKVCQRDSQLQSCQGNQDKLFRQVTFVSSNITTEASGHKYNAFGRVFDEYIEQDISEQKLHKYNTFEKNLKPNIGLPNFYKGNSRKNLNESLGFGKLSSHSVANSDLERIHNG
ncbi:Hypothetical predicted protein, partial [Marmota monax]